MRVGLILLLSLTCVTGCTRIERDGASIGDPDSIVTIKYALEPLRTFEIVGTNIKGVKLAGLPAVLKQHKQRHPGLTYEIYAEVKCVPETSDEIISAIRSTGVSLKHYWAPVSVSAGSLSIPGSISGGSLVDTKSTSGKYKYGPGHVDILGQ